MSARRDRDRAVGLIWARMVELAEEAHDLTVLGQRAATVGDAQKVAKVADALCTLARSIVVLASEETPDAG